uniref:Serpin domain-containing protein n=1 Tax=Naja naja TaxID=35670 RepID=A0A8C7E573_NAJNA
FSDTSSRKILSLLNEGSINPFTRLIMVNVLYFKGNWSNTFKKEDTTEQPFRLNKSTSKPIKMMFQHDKFNWKHIDELQVQIHELQYIGNDFSMLILLPDDISDDKDSIFYKWTKIELSFPKFKLEEKYNLKPVLRRMGMMDAFDEGKADFSGMSTNDDLVISEVVHKSFIEVSEEGTGAAAATGVITNFKSTDLALQFKVEHPFLFFIIERSTNSILFFGKYSSP